MKGHVVALLVAMALAACSGQKTANVEGTWKVSDARPAPWLEAGQSTDPAIAGTYLLINDDNASFSPSTDLMINISSFSGRLPSLGRLPVESVFG
jgi:hypothetical protein